MKALILLLITAFAALGQPAFPTNVVVNLRVSGPPHLSWSPNTETNIVKYTVYFGVTPSSYNGFAEVTTNRYNVNALGTGTFYAVVTATDSRGLESDPSDELKFVLPIPRPARPALLRTVALRVVIESTDDLNGSWQVATNFPEMTLLAKDERMFFRLRPLNASYGPDISNGH